MTSFDLINAKGEVVRIDVDNVMGRVERLRREREEAEVKAKASALAELQSSAKILMRRGLGDLIDVVDEIVTEPTTPTSHGRGSR